VSSFHWQFEPIKIRIKVLSLSNTISERIGTRELVVALDRLLVLYTIIMDEKTQMITYISSPVHINSFFFVGYWPVLRLELNMAFRSLLI
jgi:hypothetical protein